MPVAKQADFCILFDIICGARANHAHASALAQKKAQENGLSQTIGQSFLLRQHHADRLIPGSGAALAEPYAAGPPAGRPELIHGAQRFFFFGFPWVLFN
jgi:hypothetical protein